MVVHWSFLKANGQREGRECEPEARSAACSRALRLARFKREQHQTKPDEL